MPYLGGTLAAAQTLLQTRYNPEAEFRGTYRKVPFRFRGHDIEALLEVLTDEEYKFLCDDLKKIQSPLVIDIGGHIGTFALWVFGQRTDCKILSVEADPLTYSLLEANCFSGQACGLEWQSLHRAASNEDGIKLLLCDSGPSMSHRIADGGELEVESISLSQLVSVAVQGHDHIDLMKIDIEGSEEDFLCNDISALGRINSLVVELHPNLCNTERVEEILKKNFSRIVSVTDRISTKPLLYCKRN